MAYPSPPNKTKQERLVLEIPIQRVAVNRKRVLLAMRLQKLWYILIILDAVKVRVFAIEEVKTVTHTVKDLIRVAELGLVELDVREARHLVHHVRQRLEAVAAVPRRVLHVVLVVGAHAQRVGRHGQVCALPEHGLGVRPVRAALVPLEAVVVHFAPERDGVGDCAVAHGCQRGGAGDLVDVRDDNHVVDFDFLLAFEERDDLVDHGIA